MRDPGDKFAVELSTIVRDINESTTRSSHDAVTLMVAVGTLQMLHGLAERVEAIADELAWARINGFNVNTRADQ